MMYGWEVELCGESVVVTGRDGKLPGVLPRKDMLPDNSKCSLV